MVEVTLVRFSNFDDLSYCARCASKLLVTVEFSLIKALGIEVKDFEMMKTLPLNYLLFQR